MVCIIGFIFFKNKISNRKIIFLMFVVFGVYFLIVFKNNFINILGIFLVLFFGVIYGFIMIVFNLCLIKVLDNRVIIMYLCLGLIIGMILFGIFNNFIIFNFNYKIFGCYLGIFVILIIVLIILFLKVIKLIGVLFLLIFGIFEFIVSIFLGILFFGE